MPEKGVAGSPAHLPCVRDALRRGDQTRDYPRRLFAAMRKQVEPLAANGQGRGEDRRRLLAPWVWAGCAQDDADIGGMGLIPERRRGLEPARPCEKSCVGAN